MTLEEIRQDYPESILWDGFDADIIGFDISAEKVVYNYDKMVNTLIERDKMSEEEAMEYIDYNILGAYVGEKTPIIIHPIKGN